MKLTKTEFILKNYRNGLNFKIMRNFQLFHRVLGILFPSKMGYFDILTKEFHLFSEEGRAPIPFHYFEVKFMDVNQNTPGWDKFLQQQFCKEEQEENAPKKFR